MAFTFFNDQLPPHRGEESEESTNLKWRPGDLAAYNLQWSDDGSGKGYDRFVYTVLYGHTPPKGLLRVTRSHTAPPLSQGTKKLSSFSTRFLSSVLGDSPLVHDNSWVHSKTTRTLKGLIFQVETKFGNVSTHRVAARVFSQLFVIMIRLPYHEALRTFLVVCVIFKVIDSFIFWTF